MGIITKQLEAEKNRLVSLYEAIDTLQTIDASLRIDEAARFLLKEACGKYFTDDAKPYLQKAHNGLVLPCSEHEVSSILSSLASMIIKGDKFQGEKAKISELQTIEDIFSDQKYYKFDLLGLGFERWYFDEVLREQNLLAEPASKNQSDGLLRSANKKEESHGKSESIPAWFKPYLARSYLGLYEASDIILFCNCGYEYRDDGINNYYNEAVQPYVTMLEEAVKDGVIKLSANGGSVIDDRHYWRLDVQDIRELCHNSHLNWPIPWEGDPADDKGEIGARVEQEENTYPNRTVVNDGKITARVEELEALVKQLEADKAALAAKVSEYEGKALESQQTGQNDNNTVTFIEVTPYIKLVAEVQERYYHPDRLVKTDKDTYPKMAGVIDALKEDYGVESINHATAIDIVARTITRGSDKKNV